MGQKINPIGASRSSTDVGFPLFAGKNEYGKLLHEDRQNPEIPAQGAEAGAVPGS